MKRLLFAFIAFLICCFTSVVFTGCKDKKVASDESSEDSLSTDSAFIDSISFVEEDTPMPKAADELFDDFIFNFASNGRLQLSRIVFPLVIFKGERTDTMTKNQWEREPFFMEQDFYTLLFDDKQQMESVKDTCINHAIVEKIYLESGYVTQYIFNKDEGEWKMTAINDTTYRGTPNESFLDFYTHFTTDTIFQEASISDPLQFSGPDPDDDFATMEGVITPDQWSSFAPDLPKEMLYNIVYGEPAKGVSEKLFVVRGIANGLETELTFRRKEGKWMLTQIAL